MTEPRKHILSMDCWCQPTLDGDRYRHHGDTGGGWLTEREAWITGDRNESAEGVRS